MFNRKYSSWHRSHGNNFNNKFLEVDNLNKDNLNDLDLIFKLNTFEDLQLKNSWEERVAINPIYAENKIFFYYIFMNWFRTSKTLKYYGKETLKKELQKEDLYTRKMRITIKDIFYKLWN